MRARIVILAVITATVYMMSLVPAGASSTRTVTKSYRLGFFGEITMFCDNSGDLVQSNPAIGGACFDRHFGERQVTFTIQDEQRWPVGAFYSFTDPLGSNYGVGDFCQSATLNIPVGTTRIDIFLEWADAIVFTSCGLNARPGTSGTITAEFFTP